MNGITMVYAGGHAKAWRVQSKRKTAFMHCTTRRIHEEEGCKMSIGQVVMKYDAAVRAGNGAGPPLEVLRRPQSLLLAFDLVRDP